MKREGPGRCATPAAPFLLGHLPIVGTGRGLRIPMALCPGATARGRRISGTWKVSMILSIVPLGSHGEFWGYMEMGYMGGPREVVTAKFRIQDPPKGGVKRTHQAIN